MHLAALIFTKIIIQISSNPHCTFRQVTENYWSSCQKYQSWWTFAQNPERNLRFIPSVTHSYSSYSMASFSNGSSNISMTSYCAALRCYEQATCNAPTDRPLRYCRHRRHHRGRRRQLISGPNLPFLEYNSSPKMKCTLHFFIFFGCQPAVSRTWRRSTATMTDRQTAPAGNMRCEALHLLPHQCSAVLQPPKNSWGRLKCDRRLADLFQVVDVVVVVVIAASVAFANRLSHSISYESMVDCFRVSFLSSFIFCSLWSRKVWQSANLKSDRPNSLSQ